MWDAGRKLPSHVLCMPTTHPDHSVLTLPGLENNVASESIPGSSDVSSEVYLAEDLLCL